MLDLWDERILVTGGTGFLGSRIVRLLQKMGHDSAVVSHRTCDLRHAEDVHDVFSTHKPSVVIHAAAMCGGLGLNLERPGKLLFTNARIDLNVVEACRVFKVRKLVAIGSACTYPGHLTGVLKESDIEFGSVHPSVLGYGNSKRLLLALCSSYRKQYSLNCVNLVLANLYGPGEKTDPNRSHLVGALLQKFDDAGPKGRVEVWGTGEEERDLLYVDDAATGILHAAERYEGSAPLNIGTGVGTAVKTVVYELTRTLNFHGDIEYQEDVDGGVRRKVLDISQMERYLGWRPLQTLHHGIDLTVEWWKKNVSRRSA